MAPRLADAAIQILAGAPAPRGHRGPPPISEGYHAHSISRDDGKTWTTTWRHDDGRIWQQAH